MIEFTLVEIERLAHGLDALARQQKDVIKASMELAPLRQKLNAEADRLRDEQEAADGPKP